MSYLTKSWINEFGGKITREGNSLVFRGKKSRQLMCRLNYLAKKEGISLRRLLINAIIRSSELLHPKG
jgi:heat shock protein HslJ